jgi:transcriptional regulator of met regulon
MAWIGALIAGGAALIGDSMSQSGKEIMEEQMNWQEKMSDTAMQRRVTDLKAAGLNPMLAVGGNGAQVSPVSSAQVQNPDAAYGNLGSQVSSAMSLATQSAQIKQMEAQADKTSTEADMNRAQMPYTGETASKSLDVLKARENEINQNAWKIAKEFDLTVERTRGQMQDNEFQLQLFDLKQKLMELDVARGKLGLPKLENDAAWQKLHPNLGGWLQSGAVPAGVGVVNSAARVLQ